MHKVDPSGRNWATEVEWRHRGYTAKIDTVRSGGRRCVYDIFGPDDIYVGSAHSLREAAEVIDAHRTSWIDEGGADVMALLTRRMTRKGWHIEWDNPTTKYRAFARNGDESGDAMMVDLDREGFTVRRYTFSEGEGPAIGFPWSCFSHLVTPSKTVQTIAADAVADILDGDRSGDDSAEAAPSDGEVACG